MLLAILSCLLTCCMHLVQVQIPLDVLAELARYMEHGFAEESARLAAILTLLRLLDNVYKELKSEAPENVQGLSLRDYLRRRQLLVRGRRFDDAIYEALSNGILASPHYECMQQVSL